MSNDEWVVGMPQCPECLAILPFHAVDIQRGQKARVTFVEQHAKSCSRYREGVSIIAIELPTAKTIKEGAKR